MKNLIPTPKKAEVNMVPAPTPPQSFQMKMDESLLKNGIFYIDEKYENKTIIPICKGITALNMLEEKDRPETIRLMINSGGGSVASCQQLLHTMAASKIPIETHAIGMTCSAGVFTLIAGTKGKRYVYDGCSLMSHVWAGGAGYKKEAEHKESQRHNELMSDWMERHYKFHTKKSISYIRKHLLFYTDKWLSPEEALKHGVADEIISSF